MATMSSILSEKSAVDAQQRRRILAAALDQLRSEGVHGLRVRSIAALAGCSTTGVYTWFGGKDGLLRALYTDGFERFTLALAGVPTTGGRDELSELARAYRCWSVENPTHYRLMFGGLVPGLVGEASLDGVGLSSFDILVDAVQRSIDGGDLVPGDATGIAYHLWAGIHGYIDLAANRPMTMIGGDDELFERGLVRLLDGLVTVGHPS